MKVEKLLAEFHFNGKAIGVSQNLESESQVLRDGVVVLKVKRPPSSGKVVENTFLLSFANPLFHDSVKESHVAIVPTHPQRGSSGKHVVDRPQKFSSRVRL